MLLVLVIKGKEMSHNNKIKFKQTAKAVSDKIYLKSEHTIIHHFATAAVSHLTTVQN